MTVDICIGRFSICNCTGGSITGSRVAGSWGRIPVEESIRDSEDVVLRHGWRAGTRVFAAGTFVDNIFCAAMSLGGALIMQDTISRRLRNRWRLGIKPSSREAMPVAGAPEIDQLEEFRAR